MRDSVILLSIKTNNQSDIFIYSVLALLSARLLFMPLRYFDCGDAGTIFMDNK